MIKKLFSLFASLTLSVGLCAINNVPYIDANGQPQQANNVTGVINTTDTLKAGWYVVMPGSEKQTGTLVCQGEVHLIVYDGAKLTATGADNKPGIEVSGEGNSLTIYGYTNQSGQLIAIGGANAAGIGGGLDGSGSNITINGGIVTATGGSSAAGIGGGKEGSGSNITILAGTVTATGGSSAAGIGGGDGESGSNIFVATSLVVKADGNNPPTTVIANDGTDLAGKLDGKQYVTVEKAAAPAAPLVPYITPVYNTEGVVTSGIARWDTLACEDYTVVENATEQVTWGVAGDTTWYVVKDTISLAMGAICVGDVRLILADSAQLTATGAERKAGIQVSGDGNSLAIYGQAAQIGQLIAQGGESGAAGIGGEWGDLGSNITINGGIVTAIGGNAEGNTGAGIGGGYWGEGKNITINGGTVTAIGGENASSIGGGNEASASDIIVATNLLVIADGNNPPTTVIENDGTDLADKLEGKRYAILKTLPYDTVSVTIKDTLCYQQLFISRLQSVTPMQDTTFNDTIVKTVYKDSTFRDSIYIYELKVLPDVVIKDAVSDKVCYNTEYAWALPEGNRTIDGYTVAGVKTLYDTVRNSLNCDSIIYTLNLTVWPEVVENPKTTAICQNTGYDWIINTEKTIAIPEQHETGTFEFRDTIKNILGCDSVISILSLTVNPVYLHQIDEAVTLCEGDPFLWNDVNIAAVTVDDTKEYTYYGQTIHGCDSIVTIALLVHPDYNIADAPVTLCEGEAFDWNEVHIAAVKPTDAKTYTRNGQSVYGCDSISTVELTVNPIYDIEFKDTICPAHLPYVWENTNYTESGDYTKTLSTIHGCDSVVTLHLLVSKPNADMYMTYDELPASVKYNTWLLMIHKNNFAADYNLNPTEAEVKWYKVVGEKDNYLEDASTHDDEFLGTGYAYTADKSLQGEYYAIIDIPELATADGCGAIYRTVVLGGNSTNAPVMLFPNRVKAGQSMTITNMMQGSSVHIYDATGQLIEEHVAEDSSVFTLRAAGAAGVYMVNVHNDKQDATLKYIVVE